MNVLTIDLFSTPELWPADLKSILDSYSQDDNTYESCKAMKLECEAIGYTFDYYLDAVPYDLRKVDGLTVKQGLIQGRLFKDRTTNKFFTVDIYRPFATNDGEPAYYVVGSKVCAYTEDVLMTAIYKGYYKKGLTNIISCK